MGSERKCCKFRSGSWSRPQTQALAQLFVPLSRGAPLQVGQMHHWAMIRRDFFMAKAEDLPDVAGLLRAGVAAPSMKAALEAWGADSNLFHQGAAKESTDPDVVAATMTKPALVLKGPVGLRRFLRLDLD